METVQIEKRYRHWRRLHRVADGYRRARPADLAAHEGQIKSQSNYWSQTKRPLNALIFVCPLMLFYELGTLWLGGGSEGGADSWFRASLGSLGLAQSWLPAVMLAAALVCWQVLDGNPVRVRGFAFLGMLAESVILAGGLFAVSNLVDLGLARLGPEVMQTSATTSQTSRLAPWLGFMGAGIYEEALFRLLAIPVICSLLRWGQASEWLAGTASVTGSAVLFAWAHHVGASGEPFTWFAFLFRWAAGVYFAGIFLLRGFGIAVGAHTAYDVLVGSLGNL